MAIHGKQSVDLFLGFDSFGDDFEIEAPAEFDYRIGDDGVALAARAVVLGLERDDEPLAFLPRDGATCARQCGDRRRRD